MTRSHKEQILQWFVFFTSHSNLQSAFGKSFSLSVAVEKGHPMKKSVCLYFRVILSSNKLFASKDQCPIQHSSRKPERSPGLTEFENLRGLPQCHPAQPHEIAALIFRDYEPPL